jgi:hypothetical protein
MPVSEGLIEVQHGSISKKLVGKPRVEKHNVPRTILMKIVKEKIDKLII